MELLRQYALSVISIAILGGIVSLFFHGSSHESTVKLIVGLMVTVTVVSPLLENRKLSVEDYLRNISVDADHAVHYGEGVAGEAEAAYIKETMESYISSKGKELGMEISAEITLSDAAVKAPEKVVISGKFTPYTKKRLGDTIHLELGISEERQIWISRN